MIKGTRPGSSIRGLGGIFHDEGLQGRRHCAGYTTREEAERVGSCRPSPNGGAPGRRRPRRRKPRSPLRRRAVGRAAAAAERGRPRSQVQREGTQGRPGCSILAYRHYDGERRRPAGTVHREIRLPENAAYRELLNKHGQPCNAGPAAKAAFLTRFRRRSWPSISAHPNKFNLDECGMAEPDKDKWVGFQWRLGLEY